MDLMSTAQLLGNFGEFVGAIGVVGTLIYLAVQVRHSKDALDANTSALDESRNLTKADAVRQLTQRWDEIMHRIAENRETASIFVGGNKNLSDLDEVEQFIYGTQIVQLLDHQLAAREMSSHGFLDRELADLIDVEVGNVLRQHPGARTYWEAIQHGYPHREHVNKLIEQDKGLGIALGMPVVPPAQR